MAHVAMPVSERNRLMEALKNNAENDDPIMMSSKDTSFVSTASEMPDCEVLVAIRSVPCHY